MLNICSLNDISFLALFGSYAHGNAMNDSDVDLLVRFSKRKGLLDLVRIEREISDMLSKKVDLVTESSVSTYLIERI